MWWWYVYVDFSDPMNQSSSMTNLCTKYSTYAYAVFTIAHKLVVSYVHASF